MSSSKSSQHHLSPTICGIVCSGLHKQVGSSLDVTVRTIQRHLQKCKHCNHPNASELLRELQSQIESIHQRIRNGNNEESTQIIAQYLPRSYNHPIASCMKCGYTGKQERVKKHTTSDKSTCKNATILISNSGRMNTEYEKKLVVSDDFLDSIKKGKQVLPWKNQMNLTTNITYTNNTNEELIASPPSRQLVSLSSNFTCTVPTTQRARGTNDEATAVSDLTDVSRTFYSQYNPFYASTKELNEAASIDYEPKATTTHRRAKTEMILAFGDTNFTQNWDYLNIFFHKIIQQNTGSLKQFLINGLLTMEPNRYNPTSDPISLKILLSAGQLWLESQSANNDVRDLCATFRSQLYQIGTVASVNEETQLRGKTFVPTAEVKDLVKIFQTLMIYLCRSNWTPMKKSLSDIGSLLNIVGTLPTPDSEEGSIHKDVTRRVVDTNIIPGLLLAIMLDKPTTPNGHVIIDDFIALRAVQRDTNGGLKVRAANGISKEMNQILRLGRHGAASQFNRAKLEMQDNSMGDFDFTQYVNSKIPQIRQSLFTDSLCKIIRLGREISNKNPTQVHKAHDPLTGEIIVGNVSIPKSIWSRAIPITTQLLHEPFEQLFQCHHLLASVLNTSNKVTWAGAESVVTVVDDEVHMLLETIPLSDLTPTLSGDNVQMNVNKIWNILRGAMAYLSSGAARGAEVSRLPSKDNWILVFNMLRFETYSKKNETWGQHTNTTVERYLPPSISRYAMLAFFCLFPAVESHFSINLPQDDTAGQAADQMFQTVMQLQHSIGTKFARDAIGCMTNYSFPQYSDKVSTQSEFAMQFSHSSEIHSKYYSSLRFARANDGRLIRDSIMIARSFHEMLGEPSISFAPSSIDTIDNGKKLNRESLNSAAMHAYRSIHAHVTPVQEEAILIIDDEENRHNVFVLMGCGTGKSGLYILLLIARHLSGMKKKKILVISPHNPLLCQHTQQAVNYFVGLGLSVASIENIHDVNDSSFTQDFDLCFISIHAFCTLVRNQRSVIESWQLDTIFIDEIHLMYAEFFRHSTSWDGLENLSSFGVKIVCMSATITESLISHIKQYLKMGEIVLIGNPTKTQYHIPNVAINVRQSTNLQNDVIQHVRNRYKEINSAEHSGAIHVVTLTKRDAEWGAQACKDANIKSFWLTSACSSTERRNRMQAYGELQSFVIWTTYDVGYDSSFTKDVVIMGGSTSIISLIQAIGRIRPNQQKARETRGQSSQVTIFYNENITANNTDINEIKSRFNNMSRLGMFDKNIPSAMGVYLKLYTPSHVKRIMNGNKCYLKQVLERIDVFTEKNCGICSFCTSNDNITIVRNAAKRSIEQQMSDKEFVTMSLQEMETRCYVCESTTCSGTCSLKRGTFCFRCFSTTCVGRQDRSQCGFSKAIFSGACKNCFLPQSLRRGNSNNLHNIGQCAHKERLKRVLLHNIRDGNDALQKLDQCWTIEKDFVTILAGNLRAVRSNKRPRM